MDCIDTTEEAEAESLKWHEAAGDAWFSSELLVVAESQSSLGTIMNGGGVSKGTAGVG